MHICGSLVQTFPRARQGLKAKTINLSLAVVRHILNVAHKRWRVDIGGGHAAPLLLHVPKLTLRSLIGQQRSPRPISWNEQGELLPRLPVHLGKMALSMLNTGARDDVVCRLRWDWEIQVKLDGKRVSVFEVPYDPALVRKKSKREFDYVVCNSVAQELVEAQRDMHEEFVFVWRRERFSTKMRKRHSDDPPMAWAPISTMNNTAWQRARREAGLGDLHVHDLRHTVGMRMREVGVLQTTISEVLWHHARDVTLHYAHAQVEEIRNALERIGKVPVGHQNQSLRGLSKGAQRARVPSVSLRQEKTG